jgi:hypothetical protein
MHSMDEIFHVTININIKNVYDILQLFIICNTVRITLSMILYLDLLTGIFSIKY